MGSPATTTKASANGLTKLSSRPNRSGARATPAGLPLDGVTPEALAARHACRRGEAKAPASLPRRVRLPLQPAPDKRRRPHRGPHHRAACRPPTAHDENADPRNGALSSFPELTA